MGTVDEICQLVNQGLSRLQVTEDVPGCVEFVETSKLHLEVMSPSLSWSEGARIW